MHQAIGAKRDRFKTLVR
jgi:citrate synthase